MSTVNDKARRLRCNTCNAVLPGPYGTPGVAMSRKLSGVLLCAKCGTEEALLDGLKNDLNKSSLSPDRNVANGKTILLAELHAANLIERHKDMLGHMRLEDLICLGVLEGMIVGMELLRSDIDKESVRTVMEQWRRELI